jgi:aspartyl/asparaginyl beta-hydroxylase (cupin superfamily)
MPLSQLQAEQMARAGAAALRAGNPADARDTFERLVADGQVNAKIWLLLAHACWETAQFVRAEEAADQVLSLDRHDLRALILKGDCRFEAKDDRAASSFYATATRLARQIGSLPPDLAEEVARAERASHALATRFRTQLETQLAQSGIEVAHQSDRFRESLELMFGEKEIYYQKPSAYYFPRLPQIQFYDRSEFAWAGAIEGAVGEMRAELEAALRDQAAFKPYLESRRDRPTFDFHGLLDNPDWSTLYLWENGGPVEKNVARFPKTFAALDAAPLAHITIRAPSILFSLLRSGARIAPHHGMINTRLICHLPLIVPSGCGFRVGNEIREWEEGKLLIFDDTIEHEAWNDSGQDRIILIFDIWRPELTMAERSAIASIFTAIDG